MESIEIKIVSTQTENGTSVSLETNINVPVLDIMVALEKSSNTMRKLVSNTLKRKGITKNVRNEIKKLTFRDIEL